MRLINRIPGRSSALVLAIAPFLILALVYLVASAERRAVNPADKLLPSVGAMADGFAGKAFKPDQRTGKYLLWTDTGASLGRIGLGLGISSVLALVLGIGIGFLPLIRVTLAPVVSAISLVPPLAVLPILFLTLGLGEASKVALIVIGCAPVMVRSVAKAVADIPREQVIKLETLGASTWQMIVRLALPQALPPLLLALRLALGPAWIFLISAEAISATSGLGYRIFLERRSLSMDVILPYVVWITLLAYLMDLGLRGLSRWGFRWAHTGGGSGL